MSTTRRQLAGSQDFDVSNNGQMVLLDEQGNGLDTSRRHRGELITLEDRGVSMGTLCSSMCAGLEVSRHSRSQSEMVLRRQNRQTDPHPHRAMGQPHNEEQC